MWLGLENSVPSPFSVFSVRGHHTTMQTLAGGRVDL